MKNRSSNLAFCIVWLVASVTFAAENPQNWEPPKESRGEPASGIAFRVQGEFAYGTFVSTASFAEVWGHYVRKLGGESPDEVKSFGPGGVALNEPYVLGDVYGSSRELAATLIRRERDRQISISLVGIDPARVRIFVSILPRASHFTPSP